MTNSSLGELNFNLSPKLCSTLPSLKIASCMRAEIMLTSKGKFASGGP